MTKNLHFPIRIPGNAKRSIREYKWNQFCSYKSFKDVNYEISIMRTTPQIQRACPILIVHNDSELIVAATKVLGKEGYTVDAVTTGKDAITRVTQKRYGTILLDVGVLNSHTSSVFHSLTQLAPQLPIILIITPAESGMKSELLSLGAFEYLWKPYEEYQLKETLRRAIETNYLRKIAETTTKGLIASSERYRSIVQTAQDAIILGNPEGSILSWNLAAEQMFGYGAEEIVGRPLTLLMPSRYRHAHQQGLERIRANHTPRVVGRTVELHGLKKCGEEFPIELSLSRSVETDEVFFCGIIRDISERKKAEQDLKERNRLLALDTEIGQVLSQSHGLRALLQGCTEALVRHLDAAFARIWTLNSQQNLLELQGSAGLYTHLNGRHKFVPVGQLKIGEIAATKKPHLTNAVIGDPRVTDQEWAKREGLVAFAGYPLMRNQEVVGVMAMFSRHPLTPFTLNSLGMVADRITTAIEREIAKEAHLKVAKRSEQILSSAGEGIYGLDLECKTTFVNPAGAMLLGYETEDLIGVSVHTAVHQSNSDASDHSKETCPMCATLKSGEVYHADNEVLWRKDGTSFPAEYTSTPIWENEQLAGAVVTFQDITERKRIAEQLLEEAKLAEVTRVLGDITHDMKNMLMPVLNGAKLLEEELEEHFARFPDLTRKEAKSTDEFTQEAIGMIVNNTRRIHDRVREIADTVKGTISPLRFAPCQIASVAEEVFASLRLYACDKRVTLHAQELHSLPLIYADKSRLFNALYNLVNNAIPETPSGGTVTVGGHEDPDPSIVTLTVADTGNGMPPEICDRLFTKEAISLKIGGTGLGTKIVKDVVDAHGGTISVESEQGKGTLFTIHLPIHGPSR